MWKHDVVKVNYGKSLTVADTPKNLEKFSRQISRNKKHPDSGFPQGRFLGVFCLATGGLIDLKVSNWKGKGNGELSSLRQLWSAFRPGETILADALFSNFFVIEKALSLGVHLVTEFPKGRARQLRLRKIEQTVPIKKGHKPSWMGKEVFGKLPRKVTVRMIKVTIAPKGFRSKAKWILITHLAEIAAEEIRELYRSRWQVEPNYRSIKTMLGFGHIPTKSPEMVEKHIWVHMTAYNIVRIPW